MPNGSGEVVVGEKQLMAREPTAAPQGPAGIWAPGKEPQVAQVWGTMSYQRTCSGTRGLAHRIPRPSCRVAGVRMTAWSPHVILGGSSRWQGLVNSHSAVAGDTPQLSNHNAGIQADSLRSRVLCSLGKGSEAPALGSTGMAVVPGLGP